MNSHNRSFAASCAYAIPVGAILGIPLFYSISIELLLQHHLSIGTEELCASFSGKCRGIPIEEWIRGYRIYQVISVSIIVVMVAISRTIWARRINPSPLVRLLLLVCFTLVVTFPFAEYGMRIGIFSGAYTAQQIHGFSTAAIAVVAGVLHGITTEFHAGIRRQIPPKNRLT